jgi:CCR4-NOT transcription complex subunit 9
MSTHCKRYIANIPLLLLPWLVMLSAVLLPTAHVPLFLYPFLNTVSKTRPFEYLRLTSLGVIGALVKVDDTDVINFLLSTEIIPLCLRTMEMGSELSKTVATFIVQKILLDDVSGSP